VRGSLARIQAKLTHNPLCNARETGGNWKLKRWDGSMKNSWVHLPLFMLLANFAVLGQEFKRFELQPLVGLSATGSIPLRSEDGVDHGSVHVGSSYHLGGTFAVYLNELDAIEALWQRQFTEGRLPGEFAIPLPGERSPAFNLKIDQIHCNLLHHYRIDDPRAAPYVMAGLGATTYYVDSNGQTDSKSHFSFALGGGIKYFFTSRLAFRGEARWSPVVLSASDSKLWCNVSGGATCFINLRTSVQHQVHLAGGLIFRF